MTLLWRIHILKVYSNTLGVYIGKVVHVLEFIYLRFHIAHFVIKQVCTLTCKSNEECMYT